MPHNAMIEALRALAPQLDFRAVSNNLWSASNEYGVGFSAGMQW
jgi:hypothetical protein